MQNLLKTAKKTVSYVMGFIPQPLPIKGMTEFDKWADGIFETYGLPNLPSYKQALASMIMHLGNTTDTKSRFYFAKAIKKAMANQIAYEKIQQLKKEEKEYLERTKVEDAKSSEIVAG